MSAFEQYLKQVDEHLQRHFVDTAVAAWWQRLRGPVAQAYGREVRNPAWEQRLAELPDLAGAVLEPGDEVRLRAATTASAATRGALSASLQAMLPWRKGPFDFCGVTVDAEWRSDWKWQRVRPHLAPLTGRRILDVGCGNGYYAWRMLGAGARVVVGLDPAWLALAQFRALQRYLPQLPVVVLPLGSEALDRELPAFDTVFSMGVLYHRRDPVSHLRELRRALRPGGQLVLETLVIDSREDDALVPQGRYARMRNVWSIPSPSRAIAQLTASGFTAPRLVDLCRTTVEEQRATAWMRFQSLSDFLDPVDHSRTVEGHPAPLRAVFIAAAP